MAKNKKIDPILLRNTLDKANIPRHDEHESPIDDLDRLNIFVHRHLSLLSSVGCKKKGCEKSHIIKTCSVCGEKL